ncbi:HTTM domain protein [Planctopirus limnophila DSM 3776]|uniref:HTTM domain protein n=1 Tax=Planctopirus limnophila (strain ATCC 43296 / DSM 3776 / IFAM 1008 / Mu 290) TaxID=521674 RepID=D5SN79_PLAL2|nr:HTTM domain-containing protein [Planctopirus limnophila]ADG66006.1 HTTM domain protein [Planctopirus limnophila DSM 3776]
MSQLSHDSAIVNSTRSISELLRQQKEQLNEFFFAKESPIGVALTRIVICATVFIVMLDRWKYVREIYSTDGAPAQISVNFGFGELFPVFSGSVVAALFAIMLFALLTAMVGWKTRLSLIVANLLFIYFCNIDYVTTLTKYSVIATHILLLLTLSRCGDVFSVDAWLKRTAPANPWLGRTIEDLPQGYAWPRRCIQIMIGTVYFGAAITKIHTPTFFSGDQLQWWMLTELNYEHPVGAFISMYPAVIVVMCYIAVIWEIMFIVLAWRGVPRMIFLTLGVIFHAATFFTLGLLSFPPVCFACYLAFMNDNDARWLASHGRWIMRKFHLRNWIAPLNATAAIKAFSIQSPQVQTSPATGYARVVRQTGLWGACCACLALMGVATEYQVDRYGVRRPEGPMVLEPMDQAVAKKFLSPAPKFREVDKFFAIDVGTLLVADQLAIRKQYYQIGETMIVQCQLLPPHEDMYLECLILNEEGQIEGVQELVATREMNRANFNWPLCENVQSGRHQIVIRSAGQEIARRTFFVNGETCDVKK